jgi:hypothetical protein
MVRDVPHAYNLDSCRAYIKYPFIFVDAPLNLTDGMENLIRKAESMAATPILAVALPRGTAHINPGLAIGMPHWIVLV